MRHLSYFLYIFPDVVDKNTRLESNEVYRTEND